ncbi:hypothetical protein LTR10_014882 [Elasticomyces elasticus]|uniref:Zn(2)-C6 fungal-type domain-containing protein n=1 Tax=Exophiala sideris TaxID=1016849 RepID=A0ABR0JFQ7_9EURO|nr:hypothetical protein LTR10_014882 [Elasticomyces elasticus]KAK5025726.1 hypothetical protein LTS07_007930 [Exophiala sideris]KAK5033066.1 hypothetical protein LTR13_007031 [Exophiala sideris]KAK5063551.1 hypothetical protein LTR69_004257 [Exophiala sideris]KAK5180617.1 hypothetical protein LTR44_006931 [Eurotiomycetes sp. CCFEE 6388]
MAAAAAAAAKHPQSKRKIAAHRKSRTGCRNCKLRKVRCDETHPRCIKCDTYGILCNYDLRHEDLQLSTGTRGAASTAIIDLSILDLSPAAFNLSSENHLTNVNGRRNTSNSNSERGNSTGNSTSSDSSHIRDNIPPSHLVQKEPEYAPSPEDRETLTRFFSSTIYTLGPTRCIAIYRDIYSKLIYSNTFLMHIILAVTLVHDTTIKQSCSPTDTEAITRHWSSGASLLNHAISQPLNTLSRATRDAMWACAGLLGCLAFSIVDAECVEQSWPLKADGPPDLDWLNMCAGKTIIFKVSDPLRDDSVFAPARQEMAYFMSFRSDLSVRELHEMKTLPDELIELCEATDARLSSESSAELCCCRAPLSLLAQLMPLECNQDSYILFLGFFRTLGTGFKDLLVGKDPVALLLLLFWYSKASKFDTWWLRKRANLEYRAIMRYLLERHGEDGRITKLVRHARESGGD